MSDDKPTMYDYIKETPRQIRWQVAHRRELTAPLVSEIQTGEWRSRVLVASGSSANACSCSLPLMRRELGMDVQLVNSGSFEMADVLPPNDALCMVISQSGCSTNSIAALDRLRAAGRPAIGLTANMDSDLKDHTDLLVDYGCGEELVGYVTKGVTCLAAFLMLLAAEVAHDEELVEQIEQAVGGNASMLTEAEDFYRRNRRALTSLEVVYAVGYGAGLGTCTEAALKLGETIKVPAFAYEAEEYLHGPNLQITPRYSFFFVDDGGRGSARLRRIAEVTGYVSDACYFVGAPASSDVTWSHIAPAHIVEKPACAPDDPLVSPLWQLSLFQYIAWKATEELGCWDGHPFNDDLDEEWEKATKTDSIRDIMPY